jgi:hypothetical protein
VDRQPGCPRAASGACPQGQPRLADSDGLRPRPRSARHCDRVRAGGVLVAGGAGAVVARGLREDVGQEGPPALRPAQHADVVREDAGDVTRARPGARARPPRWDSGPA